MKVTLVAMPWHGLDYPSLAFGILRRKADACVDSHELTDLYANLRWAEYLLEKSGGAISPVDYTRVADEGFFHGVGDWIFASALHSTTGWKVQQYADFLIGRGLDPTVVLLMHEMAPAFIDELGSQIVASKPDIVAFSTTFMQNVASLALAQRVKDLDGSITTVFGGGNCDGPQGPALHRNFQCIDYVVSGEGERSFVLLLDALSGHGRLETVPGLSYRSNGSGVSNEQPSLPVPISEIPSPVYDSYFRVLADSELSEFIQPKVVLESSRGCWWGQKHHCTFCGLNGSLMTFRAKPAEAMWTEIAGAVDRYRCLDLIMVDNIMDSHYYTTLLPRLAASSWDLSIHYELKSNITTDQVRQLRDAHIVEVQPGIESLSSSVLQLMRKGVSGVQNVQLLRDCEDFGITTSWNYLYGFPAERDDDYLSVIQQIQFLVHLQPPNGISRIALERFSPNFSDASIGFGQRSPAEFYSYIYDVPMSELEDMVYLFDCEDLGIGPDVASSLRGAVDRWRDSYTDSTLTYRVRDSALHIRDRRAGLKPSDFVFRTPMQIHSYDILRHGMTITGLERELFGRAIKVTDSELQSLIEEFLTAGLLYNDDQRYVALATHDVPVRLT